MSVKLTDRRLRNYPRVEALNDNSPDSSTVVYSQVRRKLEAAPIMKLFRAEVVASASGGLLEMYDFMILPFWHQLSLYLLVLWLQMRSSSPT